MKITKRQLRRIIKEEKSKLVTSNRRNLLREERKFQAMLINEEDSGLLKMAFQALKDKGPAIADTMKQWMKANPEIFQELIDEMLEDGTMKKVLMSALKDDPTPTEEPAT